jgi:hypothetical protein
MKKIFVSLLTILVIFSSFLEMKSQTIVGNYVATSFQSGAVLPSTCYGSSVFTLTTTWIPYYCDAGIYVAFGTGAPATTAANITNGSAGAQPYQTAPSTTAFVYPATDTRMLTLDLNRTDSYVEDGTIERPYKNLPTLVIPSTGLASIFSSPNSSYSTSTATTIPAIPLTIYGNNSTWTFSGGLTVNSLPTTIYDLNTVGNTTYSTCGSTIRSERHGGSYSGGNVTLGAGCYTHFYGVNLSGNSNTLSVNGLFYGEALTGSMKIASAGSSALLAMYNPNMTKSSGYNIDMTSGGQLLFSGGLLNTAAGTANIYLPTANSPTTAHAISGLIVGTGTGVNCVNGTTTYVAYGFNLAPITNCTLVTGYQGPTTFLGTITGNLTGNATTATTAANLSGTPALPNGTTATTQAAKDNSTKLGTTAYTDAAIAAEEVAEKTNAPLWLQYLGNGADGAVSCTGNKSGEIYATSFTVPYGSTCTVNSSAGLTIHATGSCTIAGTINARGADAAGGVLGIGGGSSGGSGGGAVAGTVGGGSRISYGGLTVTTGGTAGGSSGGNGGAGSTPASVYQRIIQNTGGGYDGQYLSGSSGLQGGSSGGALGNGGSGVVLICASITPNDGTHGNTGIIDVSGQYGMPPSSNSTGAGSGGGGGVAILSSQATVGTWPTIYSAGGPGGLVTVPEALATSGSCTTQPKVTLGVTGGALSSCTVAQAGAGCGTGTNVTFNILGGGGSGGTVTPTWSGGALASCTASGGSGYTAATYTTAGTGGDGGNGWYTEFQGW